MVWLQVTLDSLLSSKCSDLRELRLKAPLLMVVISEMGGDDEDGL